MSWLWWGKDILWQLVETMGELLLKYFNIRERANGTGTGKTFTMEGTPENRGVNYRILEELFRVSEQRSDIMKYQLLVSMLEVYNEKIRDLLVENTDDQPAKKREIKQSAEGTQEVPGFSQLSVYKTDEVWNCLRLGVVPVLLDLPMLMSLVAVLTGMGIAGDAAEDLLNYCIMYLMFVLE